MTSRRTRWAILGTGVISDSFVHDIRRADGEVTVVWNRTAVRAEEFAHRHGIARSTADPDAAVGGDDVDIVYVATPNGTHHRLAMHALSADKHVLVEKPLAMTGAEAAEVFALARARDRFAMEGMWMKFNPLHREVMARVESGLIGEPTYVRSGFGFPFPPGGSRWSAELGGSVIFNQAIYSLTLAEWALGRATDVQVTGASMNGVDVSAQLQFAHHRGSSHAAVAATSFVDPTASIGGTRGWIDLEGMFWTGTSAAIHAGRSALDAPEILTMPHEGKGYTPMIRSVQEAIAAGVRDHPVHTMADTIGVIDLLAEARQRVLESGRSERTP